MAIEQAELRQASEHIWHITPGPIDVHTHPRVFDVITDDGFVTFNEGEHGQQEGKAGLWHYTGIALRSGITAMLAMPNESVRLYDQTAEEQTTVVPYPIASIDRVRAMQAAISSQAVIPTGIHMGLDPEVIFRDMHKLTLNDNLLRKQFSAVAEECTSLKVYIAETTGGYNIAMEHAVGVADVWYRTNPGKPIVYHVEGGDVAKLLYAFNNLRLSEFQTNWGKEQPIHIAHVSSRQELEAVIAAKEAGMNVTCEVTPHHLFMNADAGAEIGGYGCMKPGLKTQADVDFLWANIDQIDMFASDCAPHRRSDKEAANPAYGVTNHTVLIPLLLGAVADGKLTMDQFYAKLCVKPRERFNLPANDDSKIIIDTSATTLMTAQDYERESDARYGHNPFVKLGRQPRMVGRVIFAQAGKSYSHPNPSVPEGAKPSYTHLIRPKNIGAQALRQA